ncbi:hypothetical protein ACTZWT_13060 [Rhodopseudomonas sp. NSM]|uniref:hypothetical protein n=1 Tax=Rhodopseudomonas sp. NSM TaxID=3457630 RepID=UPI0040372373
MSKKSGPSAGSFQRCIEALPESSASPHPASKTLEDATYPQKEQIKYNMPGLVPPVAEGIKSSHQFTGFASLQRNAIFTAGPQFL